jgi:hypothetical protein
VIIFEKQNSDSIKIKGRFVRRCYLIDTVKISQY